MRKLMFMMLSVFAAVVLVSCGKPKEVLHVYSWGDYFAADVLKNFEKKYNCHVRVDVFDSNEAMYAKLKAGAGGYDIIVPSSYMAQVMFQQKMLAEIDLRKMPNVTTYIDKSYLKYSIDKTMQYTVPYFASFTGIGYNVKKVKDFKPTWRMFERQDIRNRCSLLNDLRETIGAALCTLGYSVNTVNQKELDSAVKLVLQWKKNIAKFEVDDAKRALASGEFIMIQTYSGDMLQVASENKDIRFVIPEEGSTFTFDNFAIMKNAPNMELAHKFINYIYEPEVCAANMNEIMYITPNIKAVKMVNKQLQDNPAFNFPEKIRARCHTLLDLGKDNAKYVRAWEQIRQK